MKIIKDIRFRWTLNTVLKTDVSFLLALAIFTVATHKNVSEAISSSTFYSGLFLLCLGGFWFRPFESVLAAITHTMFSAALYVIYYRFGLNVSNETMWPLLGKAFNADIFVPAMGIIVMSVFVRVVFEIAKKI